MDTWGSGGPKGRVDARARLVQPGEIGGTQIGKPPPRMGFLLSQSSYTDADDVFSIYEAKAGEAEA